MTALRKFAIIPALDMEFSSAKDINEAKEVLLAAAEVDGESFYLVELRAIAKPANSVVIEEVK